MESAHFSNGGEWTGEMGHIRQHCLKTIVVKAWGSSSNGGQFRKILLAFDRLKIATDQKQLDFANKRSTVFHQNTTMPRTSIVTCQELRELN
ncbi:hypothetical protein TNCV_4601971 [Trichonephila clavipes]|nr:hypothetical protein TNCV_4601971 [Trichonephila clavipes]